MQVALGDERSAWRLLENLRAFMLQTGLFEKKTPMNKVWPKPVLARLRTLFTAECRAKDLGGRSTITVPQPVTIPICSALALLFISHPEGMRAGAAYPLNV
ncbi:MAG: hypothetical protein H6661_05540 [Ardenticatenaceae bacterium]|nr:hypothetical protein [Ardenticatenaceae bacterium]